MYRPLRLVKMVNAAFHYPLVRSYTTDTDHAVQPAHGPVLQYRNSNGLVKNPSWHIGLSKTGYISEAGRCLVMQVESRRCRCDRVAGLVGEKNAHRRRQPHQEVVETHSARQPAG